MSKKSTLILQISLAVFVLLLLVTGWQLLFQPEPFGRAVDEVCCRYNDNEFNYLPGEQCAGKIVDNQQCFDHYGI